MTNPIRALPILTALALAAPASADDALSVPYEMFKLDNGLTVILHEDHTLPVVSVNVWYHVGSGREAPGRTGFAHLFEHIMFEGSQHVPEGAFDKWLEAAGGQNNGSTDEDRTNYYEDVPPGAVDLALFLEADRMGFLLPTMSEARVDGQRDVVKNERRQSYENRPYGEVHLRLPELVYDKGHPYSWPVIGSMEDLSAASLEDVKNFFKKYYGPNNASLVVAGDIDPKKVRASVRKWFGDIPRGQDVDRPKVVPVTLASEKVLQLEDEVQLDKLVLVWPTVPLYSPDDAGLDLLSEVLGSGKSSRLYKRLVYDMQAAQSVRVYHASQQLSGYVGVEVVARPGKSLDELRAVVLEELERVKKDGVSERELTRVRNQMEAHFLSSMEKVGGFSGRANRLNSYLFHRGEPDSFAWDLARYGAVTPKDLQALATRYLGEGRVRVEVRPKGGAK
jgi:zinc protease